MSVSEGFSDGPIGPELNREPHRWHPAHPEETQGNPYDGMSDYELGQQSDKLFQSAVGLFAAVDSIAAELKRRHEEVPIARL